MHKTSNSYSHRARKALHVGLTVIFFSCFLPAGITAQTPCIGMPCHSNNMLGMQHSEMESLQNAGHGCCSGGPQDPCTLEPVNRIELPDCALGCYRGDHQRSLHKGISGLDPFSQNPLVQGFSQNHCPGGKTGLPPIYLQTLSLRF